MLPQDLAGERRLHDLAAVDVAVPEVLVAALGPQDEPVRAAPEFLAEGPDEPSLRVVDHDGLAPHARLVDGVGDVDVARGVLAQAVGVAPEQPLGRQQPVVHAFVGVLALSDDGVGRARLVRGPHKVRGHGRGGGERDAAPEERSACQGLHGIGQGGFGAGGRRDSPVFP